MYKEKKLQDKEVEDKILRISTLLKTREVFEILKISRAMAYNLMLRGEIPTVRIGKCRRVRPEDLIQYIKNNTYQENQY